MKYISIKLMIVFILSSLSLPALSDKFTGGVYSSFVSSPNSGDLIGVEIFIIPHQSGYSVLFQASEGEPSEPILVPATINGNQLAFTLPPNSSYSGKFTGQIDKTQIIGKFDNGAVAPDGKEIFRLKQGKSYWQKSICIPTKMKLKKETSPRVN